MSTWIKFVTLATISIFLLFVESRNNVLDPLRQTFSLLIYPFQRVACAPGDVFRKICNWFEMIPIIKQEYKVLKSQSLKISELSNRVSQLEIENQQLRRLLNLAKNLDQEYIVIEIAYDIYNDFGHKIILNKGSDSGLALGMAIVDEMGLVGQIIHISSTTSEAVFIGSESISIPVQISRNGLRTICFGTGVSRKLEIRYLSGDSDIRKGDILITSGIGGYFPPGLPVAEVIQIQKEQSSGFLLVSLKALACPDNNRCFLGLKKNVE